VPLGVGIGEPYRRSIEEVPDVVALLHEALVPVHTRLLVEELGPLVHCIHKQDLRVVYDWIVVHGAPLLRLGIVYPLAVLDPECIQMRLRFRLPELAMCWFWVSS